MEFFNIIYILGYFAPGRSNFSQFFYSFYLVFVLNILLVNVQVSHNKNNGHSGKHCLDDKTDIYGGSVSSLDNRDYRRFSNVFFRLVIYPMSGNNATLKIDFTDPRKRSFVRNLFYILVNRK